MRLGLLPYVLLALRCQAVDKPTYSIDDSCQEGGKDVQKALDEAKKMAEKAWQKLGSNDKVAGSAFEKIFRADITDLNAKRKVAGIEKSVPTQEHS